LQLILPALPIAMPPSYPFINYLLHLADNALLMGHRLSEWTGHGPILEQDIAISNIALDYIGQARNFYQYTAEKVNSVQPTGVPPATEDTLAYLRDVHQFKNCLLAELPNGDWGCSVLKVFFFATYQYLLYQQLQQCPDIQVSAIAEKSVKETVYHLRWSSEWVIRLGDGTAESHQRMVQALEALWPFTGELYQEPGCHAGWVDYALLKNHWLQKTGSVLQEATLPLPDVNAWMQGGGPEGRHTEHLGYVLAEMQFLQRAYPGCEW
jgi:ring-1,2-phenylacetyl-CoA epoxidase subunit PaaC